MLARCEETNLVLNWKKCHFLVKEGIVLGHKISKAGIKVDKAKIDVIAKLSYPTNIKGIRCFLGHAGFYRRFIKDFSKIARPMTQLLMKEEKFAFSDECMRAFDIRRDKLTSAPVIIAPNWNLDFILMCNASDYAVGAVLGQRIDKQFCLIYYASKTMNYAQEHYTTTEEELLAVVYAFDKFSSYLIMFKIVVYTDHSALKYIFSKQDAKPRLIRWVLLIQEFTIKIKDKKGSENLDADPLSRLENPKLEKLNEETIHDSFPNEHLMVINVKESEGDPCRIVRRCVFGKELGENLEHCHMGPTGRHYRTDITARKVFEAGFYWPTIFKDFARYVRECDTCQRAGNISFKNQMPLSNILISKVFDIWGIYFMGTFPSSRNNKYILVVVDDVLKWVEVEALSTNDAQVVVKFLWKLFSRFGVRKNVKGGVLSFPDFLLVRYGNCQKEDLIWDQRYAKWCSENSLYGPSSSNAIPLDKKPRPRDYTFKDWMLIKVGLTVVNDSVKKALLKSWIIDCCEGELVPDKNPRERIFVDYKWVFDLEIDQLADEYELGIGKKGHILEELWENCKKFQGKDEGQWYDYWLEEDEKQEIREEEYNPPKVHLETFEVTRYSFDTGNSFIWDIEFAQDTIVKNSSLDIVISQPGDTQIYVLSKLMKGYMLCLKVDPAKVEAVMNWQATKNGREQEEDFITLRKKLCKAPILVLLEGTKDMVVYSDASYSGLGCVLMQR
ncbi:putative nucleotidyltransferase, ribonuclease H, partial [Tanacetum coccineum]